jgi:ferric-dicitrate binding protein FerR (iron transport regulator)
MNRSEQHPESALLDQLRAGLLDDKPEQRAELQKHLQYCEQCRHVYEWPTRLRQAIPAMDSRLDELRTRALTAPSVRRFRPLVPLAAAAALAVVAIALVNLQPDTPNDTPQVAASSPATVPDLYEDLDFYLWLADHKASSDSST